MIVVYGRFTVPHSSILSHTLGILILTVWWGFQSHNFAMALVVKKPIHFDDLCTLYLVVGFPWLSQPAMFDDSLLGTHQKRLRQVSHALQHPWTWDRRQHTAGGTFPSDPENETEKDGDQRTGPQIWLIWLRGGSKKYQQRKTHGYDMIWYHFKIIKSNSKMWGFIRI